MRSRKGSGVVGLDLSLLRAAMAYLPRDWEPGDWKRVAVRVIGYASGTDADNVERLANISGVVCGFLRDHPTRHVGIESYAFTRQTNRIVQLGELGGAVRSRLFVEHGVTAVTVDQNDLRRFFLGVEKLPRGKNAVPIAVHAALRSLGSPWEGSDEGDAVLVASYLRSGLGMPGLTLG